MVIFLNLVCIRSGYNNSIITVPADKIKKIIGGINISKVGVAIARQIALPFHQFKSNTLDIPDVKYIIIKWYLSMVEIEYLSSLYLYENSKITKQ